MKKIIMPYVIDALCSDRLLKFRRDLAERKRQRSDKPHQVDVFLRLNDPYSYVLLQALPGLSERFAVSFSFHTVLNMEDDMYPAPELWMDNALHDGAILAQLYDLEFPQKAPKYTAEELLQFTSQLLHWELQPDFLDRALALFRAYWQGTKRQVRARLDKSVVGSAECYHHHLAFNEQHLQKRGHYMSAMLHYGGEWYWGLDRLDHLERRLNDLGANRSTAQVCFDRTYASHCRMAAKESVADVDFPHPLQMFFSARSPYSYLGLQRVIELADHYGIELQVKPVLPMVMRKMQVPKRKMRYILSDIKRETRKLGVPFGRFADPLGAGVERCYALYEYACEEGRGVEFLACFTRMVYSEGVVSESDAGLQKIVEACGLSWQRAQSLLSDDSWRIWAQQNLADMYAHQQWGVPVFVYGDTAVFGQDRLCEIERLLAAVTPAAKE